MSARRLVLPLLAASALTGCLLDFPSEDDGPYPCESNSDCADGYLCVGGWCGGAVGPTDGGPPEDAGSDAALPPADAGLVDTGTPEDAGEADAGPTDATAPDAGCAQTQCGEDCVDLDVSAQHCGACFTDCFGGACVAGQCEAYVVHQQTNSRPTALAFADGNIYWTDRRSSGAVLGRPADHRNPTFVVASSARYPEAIVANANFVAWSGLDEVSGPRLGGVFFRAAPFDQPVVTAVTNQSNPRGLALTGDTIFWNSNSPLYIRSIVMQPSPRPPTELLPATGASFAQALAASPTHVYWADSQADIWQHGVDLTGGAAATAVVTTQDGETDDLLLHQGVLYWGESPRALRGQGRLFSHDTPAGITTTLAAPAHPGDADKGVLALAAADGFLYYVTGGSAGRGGGLFRVPLAGGAVPERVVLGATSDELRGVAVGADRIFWTQNDSVFGIRRP